jgi:hypothetical protein
MFEKKEMNLALLVTNIQSFDFLRTRCRLFKKCVVATSIGSIHLLVDHQAPRVSSVQCWKSLLHIVMIEIGSS